MLSQDDRRQLELIADYLATEDPDFARVLREGRPRPAFGRRQWRLAAGAVAAGLLFIAGLLAAAVLVMLVGGLLLGYPLGALWLRRRAVQGPTVRPSRRGQRS